MFIISTAERKEREKEEMRRDILNAAQKIAGSEGINEISIRKIAGRIDYSPGIIYHYFKNKDEIIENLIEQNYRKILESLSSLHSCSQPIEEKMKESAKSYIITAVQMGDIYQSMMLNKSPKVLAHTSVLHRGASSERPAIAILCKSLKKLPALSEKNDDQIEIIAQIIWSTCFGLALRLTVENIDSVQQKRLIEETADFLLRALKNTK